MKKELTIPIRNDRKPLQDLLPLNQPLRINIDPCDICNLMCDFCFQSKSKNFKGGIMSDELFEIIIRQLKEFENPFNVIHLYGLGEPLINRALPAYIKRIKQEKLAHEVKTVTNGILLTPELIDDLMMAGIDELTVSLNGLNNEDYLRITNTKVDFGLLFDNLKYLYEHRGKCHIHIKIIGDYFDENSKEYFKEKIGEIADTINIDGATDHWSGLTGDFDHTQYSIESGQLEKLPICAICFYELVIHTDGSVSPCSADWQKDKQNLGNVMETSLKEIWNSELRRNMQLSFLKGEDNPYMACRKCGYAGSGASVDLTPYRRELLKRYV